MLAPPKLDKSRPRQSQLRPALDKVVGSACRRVTSLSETVVGQIGAQLTEVPDDAGKEYPHKQFARLVQQHEVPIGRDRVGRPSRLPQQKKLSNAKPLPETI